jgi:hypothetical protein
LLAARYLLRMPTLRMNVWQSMIRIFIPAAP